MLFPLLPCESHHGWQPMARRVASVGMLIAAIAFLGSVQGAAAQSGNLCSVPAPTFPCLDQPHENTSQVSGIASQVKGKYPAKASVHLTSKFLKTVDADSVDPRTGQFRFTLGVRLTTSDEITVTVDDGGTSGAVKVASQSQASSEGDAAPQDTTDQSASEESQADRQPAVPPDSPAAKNICTAISNTTVKTTGNICKTSVGATDHVPCLIQPVEGDVSITGNLTVDGVKPKPTSVVVLCVNGKLLPNKTASIDGSKFTFDKLNALSQYDSVEAIQTAPSTPQPVKTNVVRVTAKKNPANLGLTISNSSLDFGLQAMDTAGTAQKVTITNKGASELTLLDPAHTVTSPNYTISKSTCGAPLAAKTGSCSFNVTYDPNTIGKRAGCVEQDYLVIVPATQEAKENFEYMNDQFNDNKSNSNAKNCRVAPSGSTGGTSDGTSLPASNSDSATANAGKTSKAKTKTGNAVSTANTQVDNTSSQQQTAGSKNVGGGIDPFSPQFQTISLTGTPIHWQYPLTRAVVGVDLSAPSSQTIKQGYFVDFDLLAPLRLPWMPKHHDPLDNRLWLWFNPRITTLPQATNFSALSTINETGSFLSSETSSGSLKDIQGLDVSGGLDIALIKPRTAVPWWSSYENTQARLAPSFIIGGGMSTPFSTDNTDVISTVNQGICDAFARYPAGQTPPAQPVSSSAGLVCLPQTNTSPLIVVAYSPGSSTPQTAKFVDFYSPERSRFFRKAYAGFRLKTYFFSRTIQGDCYDDYSDTDKQKLQGKKAQNCDGLYDIFPGIIDLTVGQDEAVTAGHMSGWLLRMDAVYPLPFKPSIHLFASTYTDLTHNKATFPYNSYVVSTPTTGSNNDFNTYRFPLPPLNRDYFRIGIGVDLIQLFKKPENGGQPSSATASAAKSTAKSPS